MTGYRVATQQPAPDAWSRDALCQQVGTDLFFPPDGANASLAAGLARQAKRVCALCPVRSECLSWALDVESREAESWGVYGGLSAVERRRVLSRRRAA